ncbi:MAG: phosphohistidine phosphatase SixA [Ignavibacteria bacterium]|nr:MAG: phosphohistidine phosphatase SixA [Ignavibacteria bacterium]KAF0161897.1 MAG: phosphohistidine phosphatase SixA [Ignavibacteria bacterium]
MKYICLIRHAKSSWADPTQTDFERTLNERGEKDAPKMARLVYSKNIFPELMISSPATRAFSTAEIFAEEFGYSVEKIISDARIYESSTRELLEVVQQISDNYKTVFLFGHNPGITNFANLLSYKPIVDMPTCAIVALELNIENWSNAERFCGRLILQEYPKKLRMEN